MAPSPFLDLGVSARESILSLWVSREFLLGLRMAYHLLRGTGSESIPPSASVEQSVSSGRLSLSRQVSLGP